MAYWLMKSEPDTFSIEDLKRVQCEPWDGVRNYQARNMLRDAMKIGDLVFFYHSNSDPCGIVGIAEISSTSYPDASAFNPEAKYYDPKSTPDNPRWFCVDVRYVRTLKRMLTLQELKMRPELEGLTLLNKGNRLSIMPISETHWHAILTLE